MVCLMLIDFQVKNFRSFKDEVSFSMEAGLEINELDTSHTHLIGEEKLLKSAVVFGGNANGKSNLIKAFMLLKQLVLMPTMSEEERLIVDTFALTKTPTSFVIKFMKQGLFFEYYLTYDVSGIIDETLLVNGDINFERKSQSFESYPKKLEILLPTIRKNQLFLFFAQNHNALEAKVAYSWFVENMIFIETECINTSLFEKLKDASLKEKFLTFLKAADFNISDVEVLQRKVPGPQATSDSTRRTVSDLYCTHVLKNETFKLNFFDESAGTQAFIAIAIHLLLNDNQQEKVFLIDEFNRSFHLELAQELLEIFNHEKQKNQFIMTTHELTLMDDNLRQDQIWFAEKNAEGQTELFSVYDFKNAPEVNHKKYYLEGRYGAKKIILKDLLQDFLGGQDGKN